MKTLPEVIATVERAGYDPRSGRLVMNPCHGELAAQAQGHGLRLSFSKVVPPDKIEFFGDPAFRVNRELIVPGREG